MYLGRCGIHQRLFSEHLSFSGCPSSDARDKEEEIEKFDSKVVEKGEAEVSSSSKKTVSLVETKIK